MHILTPQFMDCKYRNKSQHFVRNNYLYIKITFAAYGLLRGSPLPGSYQQSKISITRLIR